MTDPVSGLSRGYGFVRFHDALEQQDALNEMNGVYCGSRPMRVSLATPKNSNARYHQLALQAPALVQQPTDPHNTTVFVGGLSCPVGEDELRHYFSSFGDIVYVKIPPNKGCGFVQYVSRQSAELAIEQMNGFQIGSSRIRLSWGRSQNDKSAAAAAVQANPSLSLSSSTAAAAAAAAAAVLPNPPPTVPVSAPPQPTPSSSLLRYDPLFNSPSVDAFRSFSPPLRSPPSSAAFFTNDLPNVDRLKLSDPFHHPTQHPPPPQTDDPSASWLLRQRDYNTGWRLNGIYAQ